VIVFLLAGRVPTILALALVGLVYLSWIELRPEHDLAPVQRAWWLLLVVLANVPGYLALRIWLIARRRRPRAGARA
jgi:hypothetical protein